MASTLKRLLVGKPIASADLEHQKISKIIGLPVFSSDAISSTAYATGEILAVTAIGGSSLALGLSRLVPIAVVVAVLLVIVVISYRQTIFAYPSGGGSYIVSRENLGEKPAILAAASLLIDYILTVAVSISAGVEAVISLDHGLVRYRVLMCLGLILLMTLANLRGLRESGGLFAPPTYLYIFMLALLLLAALWQGMHGSLGQVAHSGAEFLKVKSPHLENLTGGNLTILILLKGFSSGAVALSGVEAISNGVPAFRKPESQNAAKTMTWMGIILGTLFFGTAVLAHHTRPFPSEEKTAIAQMGEVVFGKGFLFVVLQISTCAILTLAANTAYADFPRLAQLIAKDGYLPRQFANFGDRLVFSNGILVLAGASCALIIAFGGVTTALIPLYAVGVFTAFTLSQAGMVRHHFKEREKRWQIGAAINAVGAVSTLLVTAIIAVSKFTSGAWIPIILIPPLMLLFLRIKGHYRRVATALTVTPETASPISINNTTIVLVGRIHKGVLTALAYAKSLRPHHLVAVSVATDEASSRRLQRQWEEFGIDVPLEIIHSPYRDLAGPLKRYIEELDERFGRTMVTVVIPEFVVTRWYQHALHNQTALRLKGSLLFREGIVVTSVPYIVDGSEASQHMALLEERGVEVHDEHEESEDHSHGH